MFISFFIQFLFQFLLIISSIFFYFLFLPTYSFFLYITVFYCFSYIFFFYFHWFSFYSLLPLSLFPNDPFLSCIPSNGSLKIYFFHCLFPSILIFFLFFLSKSFLWFPSSHLFHSQLFLFPIMPYFLFYFLLSIQALPVFQFRIFLQVLYQNSLFFLSICSFFWSQPQTCQFSILFFFNLFFPVVLNHLHSPTILISLFSHANVAYLGQWLISPLQSTLLGTSCQASLLQIQTVCKVVFRDYHQLSYYIFLNRLKSLPFNKKKIKQNHNELNLDCTDAESSRCHDILPKILWIRCEKWTLELLRDLLILTLSINSLSWLQCVQCFLVLKAFKNIQ